MAAPGLGIAGATVQVPAATVLKDEQQSPSSNSLAGTSSIQSSPELAIGTAAEPDFDPTVNAKPYSPFYRHATPTFSTEQLTWEARRANGRSNLARDPEAQTPPTQPDVGEKSKLSKLWTKKKQPWEFMQGLSKRQRMGAKGLIAIVILGTMVAIALGITAAVGGGMGKFH